MYLDSIRLKNFVCFRDTRVELIHPDRDFVKMGLPKPKLPNVNLLLGDNGSGKSAFLRAVALTSLGPALANSGITAMRLIRREPTNGSNVQADLEAAFTPHRQDGAGHRELLSHSFVRRLHDQERFEGFGRFTSGSDGEKVVHDDKHWEKIFLEGSDAFFFLGYGCTRRAEKAPLFDQGSRNSLLYVRAQRVQGLFDDSYSLVPLAYWLPELRGKARRLGRYHEVRDLIDRIMGREHYNFTGERENGEYLFERGGLKVPFPVLSDGYRAFLGWVGDMLYHACMVCPAGKELTESQGIVMVDEIDLHLHPSWQMNVLGHLAKALPKIQFIVTSHSPLVVGSLEWMNIIRMNQGPAESNTLARERTPVNGLDADQILLTNLFGLESTRAPRKQRQLKKLTLKARDGDLEAAHRLMELMTSGLEKAS